MDLCQAVGLGFFFCVLVFYYLAGFSKKESDNFMRIPSAWSACDFCDGWVACVLFAANSELTLSGLDLLWSC